VRNHHIVLRKALGDAERLGLITRNPAAVVNAPKPVHVEQATWSVAQLAKYFEQVRDDRLFAAFVLSATTGMRRAEVLGLRWSDIDFDTQMLSVVQTITAVNAQPVVTTPKTKKSRRMLYLDDNTVGALYLHHGQQHSERERADKAWAGDDSDLVFRDELGDMVNPDWFSKHFAQTVRNSGLPKIRLHDMRHTYATLALKNGMHPKVVSERLGHASVGVTLDLYSHVTPAIAREAADVVSNDIFSR
jgi:integrase